MAATNPHAIRVPRDIRRRVEEAVTDEFGDTLRDELCWHDPATTRGADGAVAVFAVGGTLHAIANGHRSIHQLDRWVQAIGFDSLFVENLNGTYFAVYREGHHG
jgi:hypothetical protein